jgi:hypothetical protein
MALIPRSIQDWLASMSPRRGIVIGAGALVVILAALAAWWLLLSGPRRPPSIFDSPADDAASYLASRDFSLLSVEERLAFITGLIERFQGMSQSDSALVAAFFAGLGAPARERLRDNVRILGRDILLEGADGYLALKTDEERAAYLDQWLLKWMRFGRELGGSSTQRSDGDLMERMRADARRDAERTQQLDAEMAQEIIDMWQNDVASVTSPKDQGKMFRFLPAIRDHLLRPAS